MLSLNSEDCPETSHSWRHATPAAPELDPWTFALTFSRPKSYLSVPSEGNQVHASHILPPRHHAKDWMTLYSSGALQGAWWGSVSSLLLLRGLGPLYVKMLNDSSLLLCLMH